MSLYVAFLRAINVGGHTVKMESLRKLFESFGFTEVETFIASGNVIFHSTSQEAAAMEAEIASGLQNALGYEVATFIRTPVELRKIAAFQAFPLAEVEAATAYNIAFLHGRPDEQAKWKLVRLRTEIDSFATHGREVYWLCRKRQSESSFSNAVLEKRLGVRSTLRGVATVQKLAERLSA
jgi:uncharacterized protein (DUF1697 family)